MINKEELLTKIEEEMGKWQNYYQQTDIHIYAMLGACFRANAVYTEDTTKAVQRHLIFDTIDNYLSEIENDDDCLNAIFNVLVNTFSDIALPFLTELNKAGDEDNAELAQLTTTEALVNITSELLARQRIDDESLISLRTLQWVKDIIKNEKEA